MCGPRGMSPGRSYLLHNQGSGRFKDVSEASGIGKQTGCYGFTAIASDFDNDGYPDLYVACDSTPSLLYHNQKGGRFTEIGMAAGVALNQDGREQAGMGSRLRTTMKMERSISSKRISAKMFRTSIRTTATPRSRIGYTCRVWRRTGCISRGVFNSLTSTMMDARTS